MGKTVECYRMALEGEISRWNGFVRTLRKDDREAFEEIKDMSRGLRFRGRQRGQPNTSRTRHHEHLLAQQKRIIALEKN